MRLTERDGDKVWFAHGRPRGFLCPRDFCDNAYGCDKVKDRTCPYLLLLDKLAAYEDTGFEPDEIDFCLSGVISPQEAKERYEAHKKRYDEWLAWKQAEEQGLLIRLPCKVGDVVYRIHTKDHVEKHRVIAFHVSASGLWFWDENGRETPVETIGKTVFLSREEAEVALKGE